MDLTYQMVYAYEGNQMVNSFLVSTGTWEHPTVIGQYNVYIKLRYTDMAGPGYYLPRRALHHVFLQRVRPARHLLAQQLWHTHEPRLCQPEHPRLGMAVQLCECGDAGQRTLLMSAQITRRDFLKLSGAGLMGALHLRYPRQFLACPGSHRRACRDESSRIPSTSYAEPIKTSKYVDSFFKDQVISITETALGVDEKAKNRIWYKMGSGYTHSSQVQPVRTLLNVPEANIRAEGSLAEVTVPYTDAYKDPSFESSVIYRLYYETTHWVDKLVWDGAGNAWYRFYDDKRKASYYAPATHLKIVTDGEIAPISPNVEFQQKAADR